MKNINLTYYIIALSLSSILWCCNSSDSPRDKGLYFKAEIEKAIDEQNIEKIETLMVEMATFWYESDAETLNDFFNAWPNDSFKQWFEKNLTEINNNHEGAINFEELLGHLSEPPKNAQAIRNEALYFKSEIERAIKNKDFLLTSTLLSDMGEYKSRLTINQAKEFYSVWPNDSHTKWMDSLKPLAEEVLKK